MRKKISKKFIRSISKRLNINVVKEPLCNYDKYRLLRYNPNYIFLFDTVEKEMIDEVLYWRPSLFAELYKVCDEDQTMKACKEFHENCKFLNKLQIEKNMELFNIVLEVYPQSLKKFKFDEEKQLYMLEVNNENYQFIRSPTDLVTMIYELNCIK